MTHPFFFDMEYNRLYRSSKSLFYEKIVFVRVNKTLTRYLPAIILQEEQNIMIAVGFIVGLSVGFLGIDSWGGWPCCIRYTKCWRVWSSWSWACWNSWIIGRFWQFFPNVPGNDRFRHKFGPFYAWRLIKMDVFNLKTPYLGLIFEQIHGKWIFLG